MVTPTIAVNSVIKPSLVKDFGIALATLIILQNSQKCNLVVSNLDKTGYSTLVGSIVSDYRVVKTLGENNSSVKEQEWLSLIE